MEKIGKYIVQGELGKGAMGIVYKAKDPFIERPVAVKTIRFDNLTNVSEHEHAQKRFMREARSAGSLSHPNIVTIYEVGEDDGVTYIAMEFIRGNSLEDLLNKGKTFSLQEVTELTRQLGDALDYAHKNGIIHRDIKPGNILVDGEGKPHIVDFGIARLSTSTMTQTSMVMGTPFYMSPEQLAGKKIDQRADVFALGAVVYEMMTGEKPFPGDTITTVIYKIVNEDPPLVRDVRADLPSGLDYVIRKALAKNPDERYSHCKQITEDLTNYQKLADLPLPGKQPPSPEVIKAAQEESTQPIKYVQKKESRPKPELHKDRKSLLFILGAMMAVVAIVLGTVFFLQKKDIKPGRSATASSPSAEVLSPSNQVQETPVQKEQVSQTPVSIEDQIAALHRKAGMHYIDGELDQAEQKFNDILRLDPENTEAQIFLADIMLRQGQTEEARKEFERLVTLNPDDARIYLELGDIYETKGEDSLALKHYEQAGQIGFGENDSRNEYASRKIEEIQARLASKTDNAKEADPSFPTPEKRTPDSPVSDLTAEIDRLFSEGQNAFSQDDFLTASEKMEEILKLDPTHDQARILFAQSNEQLQEIARQNETQRMIDSARQALNRKDHRLAQRLADQILIREPGQKEALEIRSLSIEGLEKEEILAFLTSYGTIIDPNRFHNFYRANCVPEQYSKWKDFFRSIPNLYSSVSTSIMNPSVKTTVIENDQATFALLEFSQITTGLHKVKGKREVLMDGTYFWEIKSIENKWKITNIVYKPSR